MAPMPRFAFPVFPATQHGPGQAMQHECDATGGKSCNETTSRAMAYTTMATAQGWKNISGAACSACVDGETGNVPNYKVTLINVTTRDFPTPEDR